MDVLDKFRALKPILHIVVLSMLLLQVNGRLLKAQPAELSCGDVPSGTAEAVTDDYVLVWSDECDTDGSIDTTKWFRQTKLPMADSWHNNEIQHYTDRDANSFNDSGYMHIMAKKEIYTDQGHTKTYTSARLNSKFAFTYGKVEVRAQLPAGEGTWPAIWMLGADHKSPGS